VFPPAVHSSAGAEAVDLARTAGLILDDWQAWVLEHGCSERVDGRWAARDVGVLVPRQNGKGSIAEARELAGMVLFDERLIIHTAHEFRTAREHLRRMVTLVETCDELRRLVKGIKTANGAESIELRNGGRLVFAARTSGGGRGLTGDLVWLDESQKLTGDAIAALTPALAAVPNPQIWYTGSACLSSSEVQHSLIRRASSDEPGRLFFADWGCEPGVDETDRSHWYAANPSLGVRIDVEFLEAQQLAMADLGSAFAREHLGVHDMPDAGSGVFGAGKWAACADADGQIASAPVFALDVAPDMGWSSFVVAGRRSDGLVQVELTERAPGTGWVVTAAQGFASKNNATIWVDPRSPAMALVPDLVRAGVKVEQMPAGEFPKACAALQRAVQEGTLRHLGDAKLDAAQAGAAIRTAGDSWVWGRAASHVDITPLVAATIGHWVVTRQQVTKPVFVY
jgi:hypothetical protein